MAGYLGNIHFETEDTAQLEIVYEQGLHAMIYLSWASVYRATKYLITGTHGYIELTDDTLIVSSQGRSFTQNSEAEINDSSHHSWYKSMFTDFRERLVDLTSQASFSLLRDAHSVVAVISAAYTSAAQMGKWIPVEAPEIHEGVADTLITPEIDYSAYPLEER